MTDHPGFVARILVRSYSNKLKNVQEVDVDKSLPRQQLEDAFVEESKRQDRLAELLQNASSSLETSGLLQARFAELEATAKAFIEAFPEISRENGFSKSLSWSSLNQTISRLKVQHDARMEKGLHGKVKKQFHRVCEVMNNHTAFLKLLPQGDKYTAPICGSLELIIKTSLNHERVGEDFAAALKKIDDIVAAVNRELSRYSPPFVIDLSVQLCCHVIDFLAFPLRWYTQTRRKRLVSSFNENLAGEYQSKIAEIQRISDNITRAVQHCFEMDMKGFITNFLDFARVFDEMRLSLARDGQKRDEERWAMFNQVNQQQTQKLIEQSKDHFAKMTQLFMPNTGNKIGQPIAEMMNGEALRFTATVLATDPQDESPPALGRSLPKSRATLPQSPDAGFRSRVEVEAASQVLDLSFARDRLDPQDREGEFFVEGVVAQRLHLWTAQTESAMLGVLGPRTLSHEDPTRRLVSSYIRAAKGAGIPCISYFCTLTHEPAPEGRTRETVELVGVLYALIKQLILYLPLQLPADQVIDQQRFRTLDGTLRTWEAALSLFGDLIRVATTPYLLIAIHGFEMLESDRTTPLLRDFVRTLRQFTREEKNPVPKLKVLFATSGMSRTLGGELSANEICDISRGSAARRVGGSGRGRQRLGIIEFSQD